MRAAPGCSQRLLNNLALVRLLEETSFPGAGPSSVHEGLFAAQHRNAPPNLRQNRWVSCAVFYHLFPCCHNNLAGSHLE